MVKIAIATDDGKSISDGHFAHAKKYIIYELNEDTKDIKLVESRDNPLGNIPDTDDPTVIHEALSRLGIPMHGIVKYQWLHENVLRDVDAVIASGACETSYEYFTSMGIQLFFVEPGTPIDTLIEQLRNAANEEDIK
ncbi:NifB/NifX family molybdenum-iron cluster-binding protein [Vulcanisaeta distributa]|uniref:Dinitrogenase iron-molybdenum cofactor biosynthesis protein n=1 Tax=Vulcanisaeta distributa (strain DSM 14429 / JCM 11212 / NBRC 100878 / IC-017) TaxID=572478 RepID=E1QR52_VULDI|nr:NifB/NifX family molybdenum-iron cluster-binding protein [Vulcanisaeta distributa]ADN51742.1 Dinitrogenase iron-molybdenum cofactor biosynthesis protein [Vulcanisaeta distributa DSM 14429]